MSSQEDYEVKQTSHIVTKNSLGSFLLDGIDTKNLNADALSAIVDFDDYSDAGGVREAPTCQELAMEGETLTKQGDHREAIPLLESALELGSDDTQLHSVLWSLLGNAHFYLGDHEKAILCHSHDLAICCELQDEKSKAQAYCNLGIAHRKQGYLQRAKLCYESYLEICEQLEDCRSISKANHNLGDLHLTLGRLMIQQNGGKIEEIPDARDHLQTAAMYFEKHMEYVKENGSKGSEARAHASLGFVYELMKDTDRAIDHHQQRLRIAQEMMNKASEGRAYTSVGNCLRAIMQPDKSLECYKRGLSIASELDDQVGLGVCYSNLGTTYEMLGKYDYAAEKHEKHFECMKQANRLQGQAMALSNLAKTYEYLANINKACEALDKLAEIHKELNDEKLLSETLTEITRLGGTPGSSGVGGGGSAGDDSPVTSKKGGGIFKKLKEKRAKKRSIVGPEIHLAMGMEGDGAWRSGSPSGEDKKTSTLKKGTNKDNTSKKQEKVLRKNSVGNRDDDIKFKENEVRESIPENPSLTESRRRSWSQGNISKIYDTDQIELSFSLNNDPKVPHSNSVTFSSGEGTQNSQEGSMSTDRYVIHGPSPGDQLRMSDREERKKELKPFYKHFGDEAHKQTLKDLQEFLDSSGETDPVDLSILQEWDGWVIGSRDTVVQSTKESKLI